MSKGLLLSAPGNEIPTKNKSPRSSGRADSLAPGDIGGRMDEIQIQEYTLFGLGEVQRWSEIPPCRESNAADEKDKWVALL